MLKSRLSAILGSEDMDLDQPVVVSPEVVVEQQQDVAIAEAEAEVAEVAADVEQAESDIEVLEERVEDLEEAVEGLESMINGSESWNPALAESLYARARKIDARTFGEDSAVSFKGAESFSDRDTAQMEILSGLEDLKEKASKLWEAVKQFFINLYNNMISFFQGLFNRFRGIETKAQAMVTRVNNTADDKIKKEITLGGWNAFVDAEKTKGKATVGHTSAIASIRQLGQGIVGGMEHVVENNRKALSKLVEGGSDKKSDDKDKNVETLEFKQGGIAFTVTMPLSAPENKASALAQTKVSYKATKDGVKTSGTLTTGSSKSDLAEIAKSVVKDAKDAQVAQFKEQELKTARDKAIASIEVNARGGEDAEKKAAKEQVAIVKNGHNANLRCAATISRFEGDLLKAKLQYVSAHL